MTQEEKAFKASKANIISRINTFTSEEKGKLIDTLTIVEIQELQKAGEKLAKKMKEILQGAKGQEYKAKLKAELEELEKLN